MPQDSSQRIEQFIQAQRDASVDFTKVDTRRTGSLKLIVAKVIAAASLMALVVTIGFWFYTNAAPKEVYVYFEIKVIDSTGHPIAGATVKNEGKELGKTDSFGEWRQYILVEPGADFSLALSKRRYQGVVSAVKNIVVPLEARGKGSLEVVKTVQLTSRSKEFPKKVKTHSSLANQVGPDRDNEIWFEISGEKHPRLELVRSKLKLRARKLGLKTTSKANRRVYISSLKNFSGGKSSLIEVKVANEKNGKIERFIKNDNSKAESTARAILWGIKLHSSKGYIATYQKGKWYLPGYKKKHLWGFGKDSKLYDGIGGSYSIQKAKRRSYISFERIPGCDSNRKCYFYRPSLQTYLKSNGYVEKTLRVYGAREVDTIFVAGFAAEKVAPSLWRFYSKKDGKAPNVTLVSYDRIIHRQRAIMQEADYGIVTVPGRRFSKVLRRKKSNEN